MNKIRLLALLLVLGGSFGLHAEVPRLINYQGRVAVDGVSFSGNGQFKFALVNQAGDQTYWSHDGTSVAGGAPASHVTLAVADGLYSITLGDPAVLDSTATPLQAMAPADFDHPDVRLRVWFNDGALGFEQLVPDRRLAAVAYAITAESVPDGSITTAKLAPGSVTADKLAASAGGNLRASLSASDSGLLAEGYLKIQSVPAPLWQADSSSTGPSGRTHHSAVWTGAEMMVWGGKVGTIASNQGGSFLPETSQWALLPTSGASPARNDHTAVWTGERMVIWGGFSGGGESQTGALYAPEVPDADPPVGGWLATSLTGAPEARSGHTAVWSGSEMIIWGGKNSGGVLGTGGAYTPPSGPLLPGTNGSWTTIQAGGAPAARHQHTAVWTGTQMLVWGGLDSSFLPLGDGGIYDAGTDTWSPIALAGAPSPRAGHTAIWTGTKMVIFGGANTELPGTPANLFNDGAAFDPLTGTWSPLDPVAAPAARHRHEALWTGSEMLVVGGEQAGGAAVTTAAAYNPTSDSWRPLPSFSASSAGQTTVWSGALVLVFGPNGLQSLDPSPAVHFYARF